MNCSYRKIALSLLAVALVVLPALRVSAQEQSSSATSSTDDKNQLASVAGTVVRAGTDEPLRKARVLLRSKDDKAQRSHLVVTGADGKFSIEGVAPGAYDFRIEHDGYVAKSYGEDSAGEGSAVLTLAAGQKMTDLIFRLQKCGVITGRVTDEDGDPVRGVYVEVVRRAKYRGKMIAESVAQSMTNDLGEYRLFDLTPGQYGLRATPESSERFLAAAIDPQAGGAGAKIPDNYVVTYYPEVADFAHASAIELKAGDELSSMDLSLLRIRTYKIRGQIVDLSESNAGPAIGVNVTSEDGSESIGLQSTVNPNGSFEVPGLAPGNYLLTAYGYDDRRISARGFARVVIVDADVDSVRLEIKRGAEIHGRVAMEGMPALPRILNILLRTKEVDFAMAGANTRVKTDGSFELRDILDGIYQVVTTSTCDTCYLKAAKMNGIDVLETGLQVAGGISQPLELVYSNRSGTVDGFVTKGDDLPAVGAKIILVPDQAYRRWTRRQENATTDQYGRFTIRGVPPGGYKAFAFKKLDDDFDIDDPEFIKPFESKGESVSVDENGKQTLRLKLIDADAENRSK
jgi:protocatechuate 3,4-dioxygenase beta subunit